MSLFGLFSKRTPIEEIEKVWKGFKDYYLKVLDSGKARDPKILAQEDRGLGPHDGIGDCAEYLIQEEIFEQFCAYIKTDKPRGFLAFGIGLISQLIESLRNQDILNHTRMLKALNDLLSIVYCTLRADRGQSLNQELQNNLIRLLYILSKKTVEKPHISRMFFQGGYQQADSEMKRGGIGSVVCYPIEILITLIQNEMEVARMDNHLKPSFNRKLHKSVHLQLQIDDKIFQELIFRMSKPSGGKGIMRQLSLTEVLVKKFIFHFTKLPLSISIFESVEGASKFSLADQIRENHTKEYGARFQDFIDYTRFFARCAKIISNKSEHFQILSTNFFNAFLIGAFQERLLASKGHFRSTQIHYFLIMLEILSDAPEMVKLMHNFLFGFPIEKSINFTQEMNLFDLQNATAPTPSTARSDAQEEEKVNHTFDQKSGSKGEVEEEQKKGVVDDESLVKQLDLKNHKAEAIQKMLVGCINNNRGGGLVQSLILAIVDVFLRKGVQQTLISIMQGFASLANTEDDKTQVIKRSRALGSDKFFHGFPKMLIPRFTRDEIEAFYIRAHSLVNKQYEIVTQDLDVFGLLHLEASRLNEVPSPNASFLSEAFTADQIFDSPREDHPPMLKLSKSITPVIHNNLKELRRGSLQFYETHNRLASDHNLLKRIGFDQGRRRMKVDSGKKTHPSHQKLSLDLISARTLMKKASLDKSPTKVQIGRLTSPRDMEEEDCFESASSASFKFEFVSLLFRKLRQFFQNSMQENLIITSILSHLAAVPILSLKQETAHLHFALFQTVNNAQAEVDLSLHSILSNLADRLEAYRRGNNWFDTLCDWRRRKNNVKCAYFQTFLSDQDDQRMAFEEKETELNELYSKTKSTVDGVVLLYEFMKEIKAILQSKEKLATVFQQYTTFTMNELQEEDFLNSEGEKHEKILQELMFPVKSPM